MTDLEQRSKVAIMQPYFLPYIGYFQLIHAVDAFVVYDNIKYTKKGWINRNRYLRNGEAATFSIPLRKGSDDLDVRERVLSPDFERAKLLGQLREAYRKAPHFDATYRLLKEVIDNPADNLFDYLHQGLVATCRHIGITTPIVVSSSIDADHSLRSQEKVIAIARAMGAGQYVNPIGGLELYSADNFSRQSVALVFQKSRAIEYTQFGQEFIPWLSIVDVLMFNGAAGTHALLSQFDFVQPSTNNRKTDV